MKEALILNSYGRIGDRVEMKMDPEARGWGRKGVPDGTMGTIVGFKRWTRWVGRIYEYGRRPGRYSINSGPIVHWDNGEHEQNVSAHDLWIDAEVNQARRADKAYREAFDQMTWEADLPSEIKLWEMDVVRVLDKRYHDEDNPNNWMKIHRVDWHNYGDKCSDGVTWMPMYTLTPMNGGYTTSINTKGVTLVERGNLWKWFHDRSAVTWKDLQEEVHFHFGMGWVEEVQCPATKNYHWPQNAVLEGLKDGLIDCLRGSHFFGSSTVSGYKIRDRELGERVRAECIVGFTTPTA